MSDLLGVVDWSRAQFALTAMYHWLFVPLTIGLSLIVAIMETIYVRTGEKRWKNITKFWMTLFGINFACGVATGLVELQLVCRRHLRSPARHRRSPCILHGSDFRCRDVFRMEQGKPRLPPRFFLADSPRCELVGAMDSYCQRMDAIARRYGVRPCTDA